jgi:enediyne biosynthesis protein E3
MISKSLRKLLFGIPADETLFSKRGFQAVSPEVRIRLEQVAGMFVEGYHLALLNDQLDSLTQQLEQLPNEMRGFGYEGAAMALALLDFLSLRRRNRLQQFLAGAGSNHIYMVHVGVGWAWARLHRNVNKALASLDPLLGWLAVDGYGFHEGYFHWPKIVTHQRVPRRLSGYARRVFDQGLGRGLWFIKGANLDVIARTINGFPSARQADLWSGIGLAATYAGGVDETDLQRLAELGNAFRPQLAQGAAFAAKTRQRAGNLTSHTEQACQIFCASSAEVAAQVTDDTLIDLSYQETIPAYEIWRQRIQAYFKNKINF